MRTVACGQCAKNMTARTFDRTNTLRNCQRCGVFDYCCEATPPDVRPFGVQRRRTKNWKMPPNTVSVTRGTPWGNPFVVDPITAAAAAAIPVTLQSEKELHAVPDAATAVRFFRDTIAKYKEPSIESIRRHLAGKNLACYCPIGEPCHRDVLLEIANAPVL